MPPVAAPVAVTTLASFALEDSEWRATVRAEQHERALVALELILPARCRVHLGPKRAAHVMPIHQAQVRRVVLARDNGCELRSNHRRRQPEEATNAHARVNRVAATWGA